VSAAAPAAGGAPAAAVAHAAGPATPLAAQVARDLPMLSPRAAEVVVARGANSSDEAFKKSYLLAATGVGALSAAESRELGELTTTVYAPLPPAQRRRLDRYMERIRGLQVTLPQEDREMTALVRDAVLQLPDAQRTRFQTLYEKALLAAR
jgi:hypothetical protein